MRNEYKRGIGRGKEGGGEGGKGRSKRRGKGVRWDVENRCMTS